MLFSMRDRLFENIYCCDKPNPSGAPSRLKQKLGITYFTTNSGMLNSAHYPAGWPLRGQGITIWPLFKNLQVLNGPPEAEFHTIQSHCDRWKKRDRGVCGWKIRACTRLKSITGRGWMCLGVTSSGVRILSARTLFCTSIKTIWCLNLDRQNQRCYRKAEGTVSSNQCGLKL